MAEGRLKRAMVFPDGMKAIINERHSTIEVYDLRADPTDTKNLFEEGSETEARATLLGPSFKGTR